jgi:hypothetical protein
MQGQNYETGCLMLDFKITNWTSIINRVIKPEDVYHHEDYGIEMHPHATIIYGLPDIPWTKLALYCYPMKIVTVIINRVDIFEPEGENYDVVIFPVASKALKMINYKIAENFGIDQTHEKYSPHITLAYVKKGRGKSYVKKLANEIKLSPKEYRLTGPDGLLKTWTMQDKKEK